MLSGFCNAANPAESHARCVGCGCACHTSEAPRLDVLEGLTAAVERVEAEVDALVEACTDPEARDMAELLATLQTCRTQLQTVERSVEVSTAKAMMADQAQAGDLFVERYRSTDRKAWDHESWRKDVRTKLLRKLGLHGAQGVLTADGEVLDAGVLHELLTAAQGAHGAAAPKTTSLRSLGLDARDYCESSPGAWHVKVQRRVAVEQPAPADQGGQTDAA